MRTGVWTIQRLMMSRLFNLIGYGTDIAKTVIKQGYLIFGIKPG